MVIIQQKGDHTTNKSLQCVMGLPFLVLGGDANGKLTYAPKYKTSD